MDKDKRRKLKAEDAKYIRGIYGAITQKSVGRDFNRIVKEQAQARDKASFVAEVDGKLVGYMISYILSGGFGLKKSAWTLSTWAKVSGTDWQKRYLNSARKKGLKISTRLFDGIRRTFFRSLRPWDLTEAILSTC